MTIQNTLGSVWKVVKEVFMEETNILNLFLFKNFHEMDMKRVLDDDAWTFNNQAL